VTCSGRGQCSVKNTGRNRYVRGPPARSNQSSAAHRSRHASAADSQPSESAGVPHASRATPVSPLDSTHGPSEDRSTASEE
jgi:hypothetical protein